MEIHVWIDLLLYQNDVMNVVFGHICNNSPCPCTTPRSTRFVSASPDRLITAIGYNPIKDTPQRTKRLINLHHNLHPFPQLQQLNNVPIPCRNLREDHLGALVLSTLKRRSYNAHDFLEPRQLVVDGYLYPHLLTRRVHPLPIICRLLFPHTPQ
jgi:hypothetical protein